MSHTYLTTEELATRMKYDARTIRNRLKDSVLLEGIHYFRPFGGRKILFIWEAVEEDNRMPTDTKIVLEALSKDDDGIFPSWNSFLTSNFGIYLTGEPRKVLLSA